jgi:hypothetical protein
MIEYYEMAIAECDMESIISLANALYRHGKLKQANKYYWMFFTSNNDMQAIKQALEQLKNIYMSTGMDIDVEICNYLIRLNKRDTNEHRNMLLQYMVTLF